MKRPVDLPTIERFLRITGMPPSTFGREAIGDSRLVVDLRAGAELGPKREPRVAGFMADYATRQASITERLKEFRT